jgi:hypothetical protein
MDEFKCISDIDILYFDVPEYLQEEGYKAAIHAESESIDGSTSDFLYLFLKRDQILKLQKSINLYLEETRSSDENP